MRTALMGCIPFSLFVVAACSGAAPSDEAVGASGEAITGCAVVPKVGDSLFVTNKTVLANFSLVKLMNQIVKTGSTTGQTSLGLYRQMLDTLNDAATGVTDGPHCTGKINGFATECPRAEGVLAKTNPFAAGTLPPDSYTPVALVNRFDLAPANGANCGQYRVVFGKNPGPNVVDRMLIIFEAVLPNPDPAKGLAACLPVAQFWDNLSTVTTTASLAAQLESFYFTGLHGFEPVIRAQNYGIGGGTNTGQIRSNALSSSPVDGQWELREFRLSQSCKATACTLIANNTVTQNNPFQTLFAQKGALDALTAFQSSFLTQVPTLAAKTIPSIGMVTPLVDDAAESIEQFPDVTDYGAEVLPAAFKTAITTKLKAIGRTDLTAQNILDRAETQACAGCHEVATGRTLGAGLTWPESNGFTQIDESGNLSPALRTVFLPARAKVLENFINAHCAATPLEESAPTEVDQGLTVGGGLVGAAD